ncbi:SLC13 family permease [Salinicola aestuarinus]|uniref:SLC13 family permease n=1 Tax=Salinicola aestuarinus TaxID=1949082 RepID=UPI000DA22FF3|nr:SLC13 family permease [Salinicola aestuarinus]
MPFCAFSLPWRQAASLVATGTALALLLLIPAGSFLQTGVIVALGIGLWATGWLPQWLTALIFFTLCMVAKVAPASVIFAGFESAATWLVFSGMVIGAAIHHTGLGDRVAATLGPRLATGYPQAVIGAGLLGLIAAFFMPSAMGRIVLLVPVLLTLIGRLGYAENDPGRHGILLAGIMSCFLPTFTILPANVPNNVLMGASEAVLGYSPSYGEYLLLHFPILGLLKWMLMMAVILWQFRGGPPTSIPPARAGHRPPEVATMAALLAFAVGMWMTDAWHGISPAWIGMLVALVCLFPGSRLMPEKPLSTMSLEPFVYVAGIVSLGALAHESGLGEALAGRLVEVLPLADGADAGNFAWLAVIATTLGLLVTLPGVPAVLTPLAPQLADVTGWSAEATVMSQVLGFSTVVLPYQSPPLVIGLLTSGLSMRHAVRVTLPLALITVGLLWPLDYLWWQWLGVI